jgi:flagellar hook-associated protein 1
MPVSLLSALLTSARALNAYDQVFQVTQNNVANASTPGYARQSQMLDALPLDPQSGLAGGVEAGVVQSYRNQYAEQNVWRQNVLLGEADQNVNTLTSIESKFDITGNTGISKALNDLFQSFSAWGQSPNSTVARQTVIDRATELAGTFRQTATALQRVELDTNQQLHQTVVQVNQLVGQLQGYNKQILAGDRNDPGLDAQVYATLEQISEYVDISATQQDDGSVTVLLGGRTPLLVGSAKYSIRDVLQQPTNPAPVYGSAPPEAHILAADGTDVTAGVTTGRLGALLNVRNQVLPSYLGDSYQAGDLNTMAKQFADRVNQLLTSGNISAGQGGVPLFTYDTTNDTNVAKTLAVDTTVTADQLAAIAPGPPEVSNGIPLALAALSSPQDAADMVNGSNFTQFFANMAARVGNALSTASSQQQVQQSALAQAQNLRQQSSGVNLDEEAMVVLQFQRAYEANSRLISVLDQLTSEIINILSAR